MRCIYYISILTMCAADVIDFLFSSVLSFVSFFPWNFFISIWVVDDEFLFLLLSLPSQKKKE